MLKKRAVSILTVLVMLISSVTYVFSEDLNLEKVSLEDAKILADSFIKSDFNGEIKWDESTQISKIIPMKDQKGEISAYSFELKDDKNNSNGYVIISAYSDVPELVLEYSDESEPLYKELDLKKEEEIVYLGNLNYLKDEGNNILKDINKNEIKKSDVKNLQELSRESSSIDKNKELIEISKNKEQILNTVESKSLTGLERSSVITNPFDDANWKYQGPFISYEWRNDFENYCPFLDMSDYSKYFGEGNCGPTAISNLIIMIGKFHNWTPIVNKSYQEIYDIVYKIGKDKGYYNNGTYRSKVSNYLVDSFKAFNFNITSSAIPQRNITYDFIKNQIDSYRPFYLGTSAPQYVDLHAVAAYAYTRLKSETTGYFASYVKVADGWTANGGRYISIGGMMYDDPIRNNQINTISY